jgi:Arc/MetJ-type ribon-helix-helix transcriptional regulator
MIMSMTITLRPETERLVEEELQSGHFNSVDDLILQSVRAWREKEFSAQDKTLNLQQKARTRAEAAAHIRQMRIGNRLPPGVTIRDLIDEGRA